MQVIRIKFFNQDDFHSFGHDTILDFSIARDGYFLHWGSITTVQGNSDTVGIVRDKDGFVFTVAPEWIKFEDSPKDIIKNKLVQVVKDVAINDLKESAISQVLSIIEDFI